MAITDEQVAALRAYLTGDAESYSRIFERLDHADRLDFVTLMSAAFFEAVERRFVDDASTAEVVAFVGNLRARSDSLANSIDPSVAERLIRDVYTDEGVDDVSDEAKGRLHALLVAGLIADARYDDATLNEFLESARKLAEELLAPPN